MRCPVCLAQVSDGSRFCAHCAAPIPEWPPAPSQVVEAGRSGAWAWILAALVVLERLVAWPAFPMERAYHVTAPWEVPFLWVWGLGLAALALPLVLMRRRAGGWLTFLSGVALLVRACVPLIEPEPFGQAAEGLAWASMLLILVFFVAGTTVTFAFLYEQSFWGSRGGEVEPSRDFPSGS